MIPLPKLPPLPMVAGVPKQHRRRWYCDDLPDGTFRVVARGYHGPAEARMLISDLVALLQEKGIPITPVENVDHKSILIDAKDDGKQLYVHGAYSAMEVLLIIAKLK